MTLQDIAILIVPAVVSAGALLGVMIIATFVRALFDLLMSEF